jgi:hypothetical protein
MGDRDARGGEKRGDLELTQKENKVYLTIGINTFELQTKSIENDFLRRLCKVFRFIN